MNVKKQIAEISSESEFLIASVLLNYKSDSDLKISVPQLYSQKGINHILIIVDNASSEESVENISHWLSNWHSNAITGSYSEVVEWVSINNLEASQHGMVYFIKNNENRGYSAGNNIGIKLAKLLSCNAVLIANPDMRFEDNCYLEKLSKALFSSDEICVASSRIIGLNNEDQNPLREAKLWEELLWPLNFVIYRLTNKSYVVNLPHKDVVFVEKVSGCCMMIRIDFISKVGYLDEGVFLYCEEPILAAQIKMSGKKIAFVPSLSAIHAHERSMKGDSSKRVLLHIKSRIYYINKYSGYSALEKMALRTSYGILYMVHFLKFYALSKINILHFWGEK